MSRDSGRTKELSHEDKVRAFLAGKVAGMKVVREESASCGQEMAWKSIRLEK